MTINERGELEVRAFGPGSLPRPTGNRSSLTHSTMPVGAAWAYSGKGSVLRCSDKPRLLAYKHRGE
jgi:hypothetical protein